MARKLLILAAIVGAVVLATAWPRLNDVETGRTPEYPDLTTREYRASPDQVMKAVQTALSRLPRWEIIGSGSGPAGSEIRAAHRTHLGFKDDVTVRFRRDGGRTKVSVRSKSRIGFWDFGQNARNIRELLAELDGTLK